MIEVYVSFSLNYFTKHFFLHISFSLRPLRWRSGWKKWRWTIEEPEFKSRNSLHYPRIASTTLSRGIPNSKSRKSFLNWTATVLRRASKWILNLARQKIQQSTSHQGKGTGSWPASLVWLLWYHSSVGTCVYVIDVDHQVIYPTRHKSYASVTQLRCTWPLSGASTSSWGTRGLWETFRSWCTRSFRCSPNDCWP